MTSNRRIQFVLAVLALTFGSTPVMHAIPAFSRIYGTSCTTCHVAFPKLNDFGKAFKDAGFKFPKDDDQLIKVPPVMLGAPAQAQLFPHTVFPGTIPAFPPVGFRYNTYYQQLTGNRDNFNQVLPAGTIGNFIPKTDFQPGFFSIFTAGNFGSDISFWVDDDISVGGANVNGALGDAYLRFRNFSRFLKLPTDSMHLRVGQFELDLPVSQARSWNLSGWDIFNQNNIGVQNGFGSPQNVNNGSRLAGAADGVEVSGGRINRGYHYSFAVFDQNTSGIFLNAPNVSSQNGVAFSSDSNFKTTFGRLVYRVNLERDRASRDEVQAAGQTGPHDHTALTFGTFGMYGRTVQNTSGFLADGVSPTVLTAREPFYRIGGEVNFNYRTFNVFGVYVAAHDHNLVPVIPATASGPIGFARGRPVTFSGGFAEADYLFLPWVLATMRWDQVKSTSDRVNFLQYDPAAPPGSAFFSPYHATRNRITPGLQFLIHANIKASLEYQFRPQQIVYDPAAGKVITGPFRTNSTVAGLEWVY